VVATILKNDRRSITLIHSSAQLALAGDAAPRWTCSPALRRAVDEDRWFFDACPGSSLVNPIT